MIVRRIGPLSAAKISCALYALIGLIVGAFVALISLAGVALADRGSTGPFLGMALGIGAIIVMPLLYGVLGFLIGLISAAIYNLAARLVGGVEIDLQ